MKNDLSKVVELLIRADRPVVLFGCVARETAKLIKEIARLLGAAMLHTPDAKSLLHFEDTVGGFSFGAGESAKLVAASSDTVLAFCALSEFQCRSGKAFAGHTVIQVTDDATEVFRNLTPAAALVGDVHELANAIFDALRARLGSPRSSWFEEYSFSGPIWEGNPRRGMIHPVAAMRAIDSAVPDACRVALDVTSAALYAYEYLRTTTRQHVFSSIEKSACMGEALMASIGIRLASELPTLVITGDWCQCMTPAEIHTAVEHGLGGYVVVVWSNGGGAFIGEGIRQQKLRVADAAWSFRNQPDFARMAESFHALGVRATDARALEAAVSQGMRASRPTIIDAIIDPSVPVPAGDRFLTLSQRSG